jgi:hypothetical protein
MISAEWRQRPASYASGLRFRQVLLTLLRSGPQPTTQGRAADGQFMGRHRSSSQGNRAPTINAQGEVTGGTIDLAA